MTRVALALVDSGITAVSSSGRATTPSPGLALIEGDGLLVGEDAQRSARLSPRRVHSSYWQLVSTRPLERPFPHHLRSADLVHAHLSEVWRKVAGEADEVLLALPGVYTTDQIALLLGIAGAAAIPVRGLVDLAVAAAADRAIRRRCLHLDLHLHRAVLTELEQGSEVVRGRVWVDDGVGLLGLYDLWARAVARVFVRHTRFDPLHVAASEQSLYLGLPNHIEQLAAAESTRVTVASGGRHHAVDLERRHVVAATAAVTDRLAAWVEGHAGPEPATVLVSHYAAPLPGLVDRLRELSEHEVEILHPVAAGSAALAHADRIVSAAAALPLVTRLPAYDARPPGPVTVAVTPTPGKGPLAAVPTHLVVDGVARAISESPTIVTVGRSAQPTGGEAFLGSGPSVSFRRIGSTVVVEAPAGVAIAVNGQPTESSTAVAAGDRVLLGDPPREVLLVTMVP